MAKDDYFVIVYKILAYLYKCLKDGSKVEERLIQYDSPYIRVNEKYWSYIIWHMQKEELIEGVMFMDGGLGDVPYPFEMDKCRITPTGIACLSDNSFMQKAKKAIKDAKEMIPFI